jgi:hypothetical protein
VTKHTLDILDANVRRLPYVSQMLELGYGPEKMIELLGRGLETHILATKPVQFKCRCSRERVLQTLATLAGGDLQELGQDARRKCIVLSATRPICLPRKRYRLCLKVNKTFVTSGCTAAGQILPGR